MFIVNPDKKTPVEDSTSQLSYDSQNPPKVEKPDLDPRKPSESVSETPAKQTDEKKISIYISASHLPKMDRLFEGSSCDLLVLYKFRQRLEKSFGWKAFSNQKSKIRRLVVPHHQKRN